MTDNHLTNRCREVFEERVKDNIIALAPDLIKELKYLSRLFELHSGQNVPPSTAVLLKIIKEVEN